MSEPHTSLKAALSRLHEPEHLLDPCALDRRRFLQLVGLGLGAGLVAGPGSTLIDSAPSSWAADPIGDDQGILLLIGMYGGNDGLNTVVPLNDGHYHDQRGNLAVASRDTLPLDAETGFNPALTEFKRFWDAGQLAIVEGVGHGQPDFSHFSSMTRWMSGNPTGPHTSGWLGRWLDDYLSGASDLYAATEIGNSRPLHLRGRFSSGTVVPAGVPAFGIPRETRETVDVDLFSSLSRLASDDASTLKQLMARAQADQIQLANTVAPFVPDEISDVEIVAKLEVAARLINANLGFRVLTAGWHDFDSHANQPEMHGERLTELNSGLQRFFSTLHPNWSGRVTIMTFSEFGRTSWANGGAGTDHGSSAPQFVLGPGVRGGRYGERPSLQGLGRWERMATTVSIEDYYGSVISGWLGGDPSSVLSGFREDLGLFSAGPGPTSPFSSTTPSSFVAVQPERIYDSRTGLGGRSTRIGPGETVSIQVTGAGPIPASKATAVGVNISAINPTATTFLTAYPSGSVRPLAASLNPRAGQVVPNMSILGIGESGMISVYNNAGFVDITVDATGYFTSASADHLTPLVPKRLLDTRTGVGAEMNPLTAGNPVNLRVTERGGVPSSAKSVILNLTSIAPTRNGWITAWPSGEPMPEVASLTYRANEVVPNLVICKLGEDGCVNLAASHGALDLVGDVTGCFTHGGARLLPVQPHRILDTRTGNGAPQQRVPAGQDVLLDVAGTGGVPDTADAVVLNVTAVRPSSQTYITVYPDGESRPEAANLNPDAGAVSGNLVVAKLGSNGKVRLFNERGDVDLIADVTAYFG